MPTKKKKAPRQAPFGKSPMPNAKAPFNADGEKPFHGNDKKGKIKGMPGKKGMPMPEPKMAKDGNRKKRNKGRH